MDELGKIFGNILSSMPSETKDDAGNGNKPFPARDAPPSASAEAFTPSPQTDGSQNADFSGLLRSLSSASPPSTQRRALFTALKPYLRPARLAKLERAQSLIGAAYSVRAVLGTLGTLEGVRDV